MRRWMATAAGTAPGPNALLFPPLRVSPPRRTSHGSLRWCESENGCERTEPASPLPSALRCRTIGPHPPQTASTVGTCTDRRARGVLEGRTGTAALVESTLPRRVPRNPTGLWGTATSGGRSHLSPSAAAHTAAAGPGTATRLWSTATSGGRCRPSLQQYPTLPRRVPRNPTGLWSTATSDGRSCPSSSLTIRYYSFLPKNVDVHSAVDYDAKQDQRCEHPTAERSTNTT
jgi:hypothetical protein